MTRYINLFSSLMNGVLFHGRVTEKSIYIKKRKDACFQVVHILILKWRRRVIG